MPRVKKDASKKEVKAVKEIGKFWRCPECLEEFEKQNTALKHHIEEHQ